MLARTNISLGNLQKTSRTNLEALCSNNCNQLYSIDASRMTTLVSASGIRFTFYPFSFQDVIGNDVSGEVKINIREARHKGEMMLLDKMTTSEDRLLESAGQFCMEATQDDMPLQLSLPVAVEMPINTLITNPLAAKLFVGSLSEALMKSANKIFDWKCTFNRTLRVKKLNRKKYYSFYITELNWFACSHFHARRISRAMVSARCVCPNEELEEQAAFLVFKNMNAVVRMYPGYNGFTALNIPSNQAASVVFIGFGQGKWFFGIHPIEKTASQIVVVHAESISESQLLENLKKL